MTLKPGLVPRAAARLDDLDAAVLELRAQRQEDATDQRDDDPDGRHPSDDAVEAGRSGGTRRIYPVDRRYPCRMSVRPILITGEPVLHTRARPVGDIDDDVRDLVRDMEETMAAAPGVGLAAPQVGVPLRLFIWNWHDDEGTEHTRHRDRPGALDQPDAGRRTG